LKKIPTNLQSFLNCFCVFVLLSDKIYDFNQICDDVKQLDTEIRFAGVINSRGRLIAGGMKKGIQSLESERHDEMLFMELALRVKMRREFDSQLGKVEFSMSQRGRALAMSFPIGEDTLYVYAEPDADYKELPTKIIEIIKA